MPHVSSRRLKKDTFLAIHERLMRVCCNRSSARNGKAFFRQLLTATEQTMLAKRLAIIFMLKSGISGYRIEHALKVSPSTVARIRLTLENGGFNYIRALIAKKEQWRNFWTAVEKLLQAGLPPRGRGRWKWFYDLQREAAQRSG